MGIKQTLQYWIDISDCRCDSKLPIGGCLPCDLQHVINEVKKNDKVVEVLGGWATDGNIVNIFMTKEDIIAQAEAKADAEAKENK